MKQMITKSEENLKILNDLILNGFYTGYIEAEKFVLIPNRFPNNHKLVGIINKNGNYDLILDFKSPINIAVKILIGLGILTSIISLIKGIWILPIILTIIGLIFFMDFKLKKRKEINRLTDKILEFKKRKHQ